MCRLEIGGGDGGDEGTRTPDPRDANAVLSQLSYIPTRGVSIPATDAHPPTRAGLLRVYWHYR